MPPAVSEQPGWEMEVNAHLGQVSTARHHVKPKLVHEGPLSLPASSPLQAKGNKNDD